jgi:hypothetical protein
MKIDLDTVDEFEEKFGQAAAYDRARNFMIDYLFKIQKPLPDIAVQALAIARQVQNSQAAIDQLMQARVHCWKYLDERSASTDLATPEYCAIRAVICVLYRAPERGEHALDLVAFFLDLADRFEQQFDEAGALLKEHFPLEQKS